MKEVSFGVGIGGSDWPSVYDFESINKDLQTSGFRPKPRYFFLKKFPKFITGEIFRWQSL